MKLQEQILLEKEILKVLPLFTDQDQYIIMRENPFLDIIIIQEHMTDFCSILVFKREPLRYLEYVSTYIDYSIEIQKAKAFCAGWMLAKLNG